MAEQNTQRPSGREPQKALPAVKTSKKEQGTQEKKSLVRAQRKIMAAAPKSHLPVKRLAVEGFRTGQHNTMWHPEIQPYTTPKQDSSYGQLLLHCPPVFAPMPCTPATLRPQLTVTFSWEPSQAIAVPCLYPNIVLQSRANTITPLLQPQVLVPNVSTEVPHIRTQVSDVCTQVRNISKQVPVVVTQVSDVSTQFPEISTGVRDISNQVPVVAVQVSDVSIQVPEISTEAPDISSQVPVVSTHVSDVSTQVPEISTEDPNISNQVSSSADLVRQKELDAVDALLTLHTFSQI